MSSERDPERDQVAPTPNDGPSCHDLVIKDLEERKQFGLRKYGSLLQPNNGRSFLQDAYEEALDLCAYLRGKLEEERRVAARQSLIDEGLSLFCFGGILNHNGLCKVPGLPHEPHYITEVE